MNDFIIIKSKEECGVELNNNTSFITTIVKYSWCGFIHETVSEWVIVCVRGEMEKPYAYFVDLLTRWTTRQQMNEILFKFNE